ncbi:MAG: hypothetical protein GTO62_19100, partial [Planctomycetales bacterium]|nr:hypothetical protein [Planctomycetales bacterium]
MRRKTKNRRGVLLLVCLVLLVFFLLVGVAFVLTASNWRQTARFHRQAQEREDKLATTQDL